MWVVWEEKLFCLQQWFVSGSQLSFFPASKRKYSGLKSFSLIGARYDFGAILLNFLHIIFSIIKSQMA
jgi:hypothetical protein